MSTTPVNTEKKTSPGSIAARFLKENGTLIALVALGVFFSFYEEAFFSPRNLTNLLRQTTIIGIISVGMTMVILIEGIDLSVGSIVGLSAIVVTLLMQSGINVWLSIILTLILTGGLIGLWNGFWIAHYKIPPFIITLGMMTIARGLALTLSKGGSVPVTDPIFPQIGGSYIPETASGIILGLGLIFFFYSTFRTMQQNKKYGIETNKLDIGFSVFIVLSFLALSFYIFTSYRGIPYPVAIFAVIVFVFAYVLKNTKFGRRLYAIGGNEEAARLSGINVYWTKILVYVIIMALSSVSGILLASRLNGASPNLGNMFELDAISAVIIGGTSFAGGVGTIAGTVIGALIIGVLNNGMSLLGVPTFYQFIIKGLIIIVAVWFDVLSKQKKA